MAFDAGAIIAKLMLQKEQWDASIKSVTTDLKEVGDKAETEGNRVSTVTAGMVAKWAMGAAAIATSLTALVKKTADYGDELWKTSQKTGIAVETLSGLKLAADKSDLSLQGLATGLARMSRTVSEAQMGMKEYQEVLQRAGITATDSSGKMKPMDDLLGELADKFKGMPAGVEKTALAMDIFGKAGMEMIPLLNLGSKGLKEERENAEKLGLVMSGETARASEKFNDELTTLNKAMLGVVLTIGKELLPVFQGIVEGMVKIVAGFRNWLNQNPEIIQAIRNIVESIKWLVTGIKDAVEWVGKLTDKLSGMSKLREAVARQAAAAEAQFEKEQKDGHEKWLARHNQIMAAKKSEAIQSTTTATGIIANENKVTLSIEEQAARRERAIKRQYERFQKLADGFSKDLALSNKRTDKSTEDLVDSMKSDFLKMFNAVTGASGKWGNAIKQDLFGMETNTKKTTEKMKASFGEYLQIVQQGFTQFFGSLQQLSDNRYQNEFNAMETEYAHRKEVIENSLMSEEEKTAALTALDAEYATKRKQLEIQQAEANKKSAIVQAVVNMATAITASWKLGWPLGMIGAAIAAAACAIQIAAIKSTPLPGLAKGGLQMSPAVVNFAEDGPEAAIPLPELKDMLGVGSGKSQKQMAINFNIKAMDGQDVERITRKRIIPEIKRAMGRESFRVPATAVG